MLNRITFAALGLCVFCAASQGPARAQDDADKRVAEMMKACDANQDGSISWQEVLDRDRERAKALRGAKKRVDREKIRAKYALAVARDQFMPADSDDDLGLSEAELRAMLDAPRPTAEEAASAPAPALTSRQLEALAAANVDDQWDALLADVDKDKNKKLSKRELEIHFLFYGQDPDADDGPGAGMSTPIEPEFDIRKSFGLADKDGDKQLAKAEYPEFAALEYRRNNIDYLEYFVNEDRAADNVLGIVAGSTVFMRSRRGSEWSYCQQTFERISSKASRGDVLLSFSAKTVDTDANQKRLAGSSGGTRAFCWSAAYIQALEVVKLKVPAGTYECYVEETTRKQHKRIDGRYQAVEVKVKTWRLKDFYGIEARREEDGELVHELMQLKLNS